MLVVLVPAPVSAAPDAPLVSTTVTATATTPGNPPLPEYPGLPPRGPALAAVTTTPVPCDNNGADKSVTRAEALTRARSWLSVGIPYSQSRCYRNGYGDYRTDCSGFVSMAWGLGGAGSSFWTGNLETRSHTISRGSLEPGDALLRHTGDPSENHVALFVRWSDSGHTKPVVIEQTGSQDTIERTWSASYAGLYTPVRYDKITDAAPPPPPSSGVSGDFNGDNKDDIVARNAGTDELWLYPGTGSFTTDAMLGSRIRIGYGWGQYDLIFSGDYNHDGRSDIAARRPADGTLWVYPGTGSFTTDQVLGSPTRVGTGWNQFDVIFSGDYNQDGKSDFVARRAADGILWVYPGTGSFTTDQVLSPATSIGTGWNSMNALTAGDFNQDGQSDVVSRKAEDGTVWMYPGTGSIVTNQIVSSAKRMGVGWGGMDRIS